MTIETSKLSEDDDGKHFVAGVVTKEFLDFSKARGQAARDSLTGDLIPMPWCGGTVLPASPVPVTRPGNQNQKLAAI
ncbi:uncharacterized protein EHS24_005597 [Apiotrichum porosum]|uniref:Uncharacterized protein n=1 Tax=Apiotrichum porosum TaxID=105984 RepID=A0A427XCD6_9TREE|nr:uncharacterized protein EHS24_005597 [Apiotrichum porosum]RSH76515.1 hypothetical protein EHS24_005597 [Apiotrichum porosum]